MSTEGGRASRTTAQLYAQVLETGCLCGPAPGEAEEVLLGSLLEGAREALKTTPGVQGDEEEELLMLLSLIRAVMETTLRAQGEKGKKGAPYGMCRTMMTFAKVLLRSKWSLLSLLRSLMRPPCSSGRVASLARELFVFLAKRAPCKSEEVCNSSCNPLMRRLVRDVSATPDGASIVKLMLEKDLGSDSPLRLAPTKQLSCLSSTRIISRGEEDFDAAWHEKALQSSLMTMMRPEWKKWCSCPRLCSDTAFLSLWESAVSVRSHFGYSATRESVACSRAIVGDVVECQRECLDCPAWRKKLSILNEVLCYGSTLALQGEVGEEIREICREILTEILRGKIFSLDRLGPAPINSEEGGKGDSSILPPEGGGGGGGGQNRGETSFPWLSRSSAQSLSLLAFKAVAILLRQATVCSSSGEESDNSHASRGCLGEKEATDIERSMVAVLAQWQSWASGDALHRVSSSAEVFGSSFLQLFSDQDDVLIEGLLCLVDINVAIGVLSGQEDEDECATDATSPRIEEVRFDPLELFEKFMSDLHWDVSVVIDFLISNETCFLLYFLRLLKFLRREQTSGSPQERERHPHLEAFLKEALSNLKKLNEKGLFPYNIAPVISILEKVSGG